MPRNVLGQAVIMEVVIGVFQTMVHGWILAAVGDTGNGGGAALPPKEGLEEKRDQN